MRIEVDYSGCSTTRSVLKWIAVGVALHVTLCAVVFIFVRKKLLLNFLSIFCVPDGCWLDDIGNDGPCNCTITNYEGGVNALTL